MLGNPREGGSPLIQSRLVRQSLVLAVSYFVAGKLGLLLAFVHASASSVWPPTGIALAAFLILGYRVWPAILCAAFFVNVTTFGSLATSFGIGVGNTVEGLVGAYLVNRFANGRRAFESARDTFRFAILAAVLSTAVSPTIGVTTLSVAGFAGWAVYGRIWSTWWLGDAVGALVVAPVVLLWSADPKVRWNRGQALEAVALLVSLVLVGLAVFDSLVASAARHYPLEFLCIPLLVWTAFRFGQREAAAAIVVLSAIAITGTLRGFGPFARDTHNESLLLLQAFMGVTAVMSLALGALVAERKDVEEQLRQLAVSDPLTGLANYRQLIDVLDGEIKRSQRSGRAFAIVFLDLDRLKRINDHHGHLVGSRALCRLADVLRATSRGFDTAARFGGDEFALILPETEADAARQVGARIAARLAAETEKPRLSVSVGVAAYPGDGDSVNALLGAADQVLYEAKVRHGKRSENQPHQK
jgi:diguanylate cyclase (GGDEF)-like protein